MGQSNRQDIAIVILAAGQGTRMKSGLPKVMHNLGNRPMIEHVLSVTEKLDPARIVVVVGPDMDVLTKTAETSSKIVRTIEQTERLGTGHAVKIAASILSDFSGDVLVVYADTPLIESGTFERMLDARRSNAAVAVLGFHAANPGAYGRLVLDNSGDLDSIVEARDASPDQLQIDYCNSGVMAVDSALLFELLNELGNDNAKGEYYLTDVVGLAKHRGIRCVALECSETEVLGVNSRSELARAEAVFQDRARQAAMANGTTLIDPQTVYFSFDTQLGRDVIVGPNVVFGPGVKVGDDATIKAFCHLEKASVAGGAVIGPFARLRPGAEIGEKAHIGNFVEIKKSVVEQGAKVNHLTYIGDAIVGARANIGAGTITCNYDGFSKHETYIGKGAFIGSNNSLVAPVKIGDGAYTGSGSVITSDVKGDALALERVPQKQVDGWAARFRDRNHNKKSKS